MLGDLVSLELAAARGVDPAPVEAIEALKDELGGPERLPPAGGSHQAQPAITAAGVEPAERDVEEVVLAGGDQHQAHRQRVERPAAAASRELTRGQRKIETSIENRGVQRGDGGDQVDDRLALVEERRRCWTLITSKPRPELRVIAVEQARPRRPSRAAQRGRGCRWRARRG